MKKGLTLEDLSINHNYYCNAQNYYSREAYSQYETFEDFINEMGDADLDMNLLFRWDIEKSDDGKYSMFIGIMHQRKGRYWPNEIKSITQDDMPLILKYLKPRLETIKQIWSPLL